jgi:hypothetical protein
MARRNAGRRLNADGPVITQWLACGPSKENQVRHQDRNGVVEMLADGRIQLVTFSLVREPHPQDLRTHGADQVGPDRPA